MQYFKVTGYLKTVVIIVGQFTLAASCNFLQEVPSRLEMKYKTAVYFSFNFSRYSV